jgi:hypothetical protein
MGLYITGFTVASDHTGTWERVALKKLCPVIQDAKTDGWLLQEGGGWDREGPGHFKWPALWGGVEAVLGTT